MQKILIITTEICDMRAKVIGCSSEDSDNVYLAFGLNQNLPHEEIGKVGHYKGCKFYEAPLFALGDGWKLLAPPIESPPVKGYKGGYAWWFVKD